MVLYLHHHHQPKTVSLYDHAMKVGRLIIINRAGRDESLTRRECVSTLIAPFGGVWPSLNWTCAFLATRSGSTSIVARQSHRVTRLLQSGLPGVTWIVLLGWWRDGCKLNSIFKLLSDSFSARARRSIYQAHIPANRGQSHLQMST